MGRSFVLRILLRPGQIVAVVVPVEVLGRGGQRKVRRHERHEQHPGLVCVLRRLLVQPDLGLGRDVAVVARVDGLTGPRHAGHLPGTLAHREIVANEAHQVALGLDDVHRDALHVEAVVVVGGAEVQLADGLHAMAALPEMVVPRRRGALIGVGVVPVADLVGVLAGREGGAGRDADRVAAVRVREPHATRGQRVDVGRVRERAAVAAEHLGAVLVGHDHEKIPGLHVWIFRSGVPGAVRHGAWSSGGGTIAKCARGLQTGSGRSEKFPSGAAAPGSDRPCLPALAKVAEFGCRCLRASPGCGAHREPRSWYTV